MKIIHKSDKHKQIALWATDSAQHVLKYFEKENPKDNRPRKAIKAARDWAFGRTSIAEARKAALAAHAAARKAKAPAATAAARAAGHAAATSHVWEHAFAAESYAKKLGFAKCVICDN